MKVSGKRKRGAAKVAPSDILCTVTSSDGASHCIHACVQGDVVEINEKLVEFPQRILEGANGFVAIVRPSSGFFMKIGLAISF